MKPYDKDYHKNIVDNVRRSLHEAGHLTNKLTDLEVYNLYSEAYLHDEPFLVMVELLEELLK